MQKKFKFTGAQDSGFESNTPVKSRLIINDFSGAFR